MRFLGLFCCILSYIRFLAIGCHPPLIPGNFHEDDPVNLGQCALVVGEIQPHQLILILELESEVIVSWDGEVLLNVMESDVICRLVDLEIVHLLS